MILERVDEAITRNFNNTRSRLGFDPLGVRYHFFPYSPITFMSHRYCSSYQNMLRIQYEKEKAKDWNKAQEVH
jgi:hypothetical protein